MNSGLRTTFQPRLSPTTLVRTSQMRFHSLVVFWFGTLVFQVPGAIRSGCLKGRGFTRESVFHKVLPHRRHWSRNLGSSGSLSWPLTSTMPIYMSFCWLSKWQPSQCFPEETRAHSLGGHGRFSLPCQLSFAFLLLCSNSRLGRFPKHLPTTICYI